MKNYRDVELSFEFVESEVLIDLTAKISWKNFKSNKKFDNVKKSEKNEYLCRFKNGTGLLIHSKKDYDIILDNSTILFLDESVGNIKPFFYLDREQCKSILNKYEKDLKIIKEDNFNIVYILSDKRVLKIDKALYLGELFMKEEGYETYNRFIEG